MKDYERLNTSSVFVDLVELLNMPVCSQVIFGHCMLCIFCVVFNTIFGLLITKRHSSGQKGHVLSLKHPLSERERNG